MSITKKLPLGNSVTNMSNNTTNLGVGNIVPHWWYKAVKADSGKPDLVAITILSELWFLHRKTDGNEFNEGYAYFERKFEFTRAQLQEATLRLHSSEMVTRSFRTVVVHGRNFPNELHLKINLSKLLSLKDKYIPNKNNEEGLSDDDKGDFFYDEVLGNSINVTSEKSPEHISKRKISLRKNRSNESSFFRNSSSLAQVKKDLASFYPLVQSDVDLVQKVSGRDFTITAVNEILLKLSKKYLEHSFPNKEAFISYIGKVLSYEMRDAVQISSLNFKLNCNQDKQGAVSQRYLSEIENSRDISPIAQLRRKLAGVFEPTLAYELLKAANIKDISSNSSSSQKSSTVFTIELSHSLELSSLHKQIILEQVKAVFGNHINQVDMVVSNKPYASHDIKSKASPKKMGTPDSTQNEGIWDKVRAKLISYLGDEGIAIDRHWFSKLEPQVNNENRSIMLRAPSGFIKDWIQDKYSMSIEKICKAQNYNLIGFSC